ncbi:MAG: Gluconate 2-dehydrogenase subunit 3 [Myxococcales bacterium]|nr:Gluconate 2-dehydrogenase subunit 3 [Myxococcales bacterium]
MDQLSDLELTILGALAETLVPADDTPGADAEWARAFVLRHVHDRPDERDRFRALATHLDTLARAEHGSPFETLTLQAREALLIAHHPTLVDAPELGSSERNIRSVMKAMIVGFLSADGFDIRNDPYYLRSDVPRRDRELPSSSEYSTASYLPDVVLDRHAATWVGTGTYARVWLAAGYDRPPGLPPQDPKDVSRAPSELVTLRSSKPGRG